MQYVALIGDMVASKELPDRRQDQMRLEAVSRKLNADRKRYSLISPITITLGDEFQALFGDGDGFWSCIFELEDAMYPVSIRFALGVGEIVTEINSKSALAMDGPAFHRARAAMSQMKKDKVLYRVDGLVSSQQLVNHALDLLSHNRVKWKEKRLGVFAGLLAGRSIGQITKKLDISEQAVYRNIRDGALEPIQGILSEASALINQTLVATLQDTNP
jgi:hypothetical protein